MRFHIYKILCETNSKFYIGMSQEYEKRWRSHINQLRLGKHNNYHLQEDWLQYGEDDFTFELLHEFNEKELCMQKEIETINSCDEAVLYNIVKDVSIGGDGFTHNPRKDEIRELKSKSVSGSKNPMYGKPKSDKMLSSVKEANSKPVVIKGIEYKSLTEASEKLGMRHNIISYRINATSDKFREWTYKNA